ncbi:hypothetical protein SpiBuddy_2349 [Sphaerochaeta globosa str. Buddy]|uniref:Uncharacterized protein n=1 Tax=Sphaerochaeta globosa (strain ATCC BAA-1886 / DSM 22777 / Buddy) TaxID=158189 RepID=F0RSR2_SPHGB|nr:hypothetical protein SpiBuddy_2349 [Sphaerochaeta globosa str. Buddy]
MSGNRTRVTIIAVIFVHLFLESRLIRSYPENVKRSPINPGNVALHKSIKAWTIREIGNMSVSEMNNSGD